LNRIPVAVLGATGAVGQRFVALLAEHPWFRLARLVGDDSAGRSYADVVRWMGDGAVPASAQAMRIEALEAPGLPEVVFSALPAGVAGPIESRLAGAGHKVFTNARDHRMDADVPLVIPEVNPDHLGLLEGRKGGWIVANGNCTAIVLALALAPLQRAFGLDEVHVTTMQALSGAGYPGVPAVDITDNVLPFIRGEEEKVESEPQKTLGRLAGDRVEPAGIPIHATCTRANVREGHFESVHVKLARKASMDEVKAAWREFRGPPEVQGLPTAPKQPIHLHEAEDRPQPRRDRWLEGGMAVSVGRVRLGADGRSLRFVCLGSNTVRGAAGASVLNAELCKVRGLL
jgi:aspartate-semialdehyde dehydrogenase